MFSPSVFFLSVFFSLSPLWLSFATYSCYNALPQDLKKRQEELQAAVAAASSSSSSSVSSTATTAPSLFEFEIHPDDIVFGNESIDVSPPPPLSPSLFSPLSLTHHTCTGGIVGKGAFGDVYRADLYGQEVAVKKLNIQNVDQQTLDSFRQEVSLMRYKHTHTCTHT